MDRMDNLRNNQITDTLERILGSDASKEMEIPTLSDGDHDLLSWTACTNDNCSTHRTDKEGSGWYPRELMQYDSDLEECPHDTWRTCQDERCEEHIMEEVEYRKARFCHGILDWNLCGDEQCPEHQSRDPATLTQLGRRYQWLQEQHAMITGKDQASW